MLTYGIPPEFRGGVHMKPPYAIGSVPSLSGHAVAYRWRSLPRVRRHRASTPQGSSERVLPWQITMDQLIFASLSRKVDVLPLLKECFFRYLIRQRVCYLYSRDCLASRDMTVFFRVCLSGRYDFRRGCFLVDLFYEGWFWYILCVVV